MDKINKKMTAISLFSSGGIGDLALNSVGIEVIVANELIKERAEVFKANFPKTEVLVGDIWELKDQIVKSTTSLLGSRELDILFATPPCQGMSKNGRGKLLNGVRAGEKSKWDPRNRLIIPTLEIALKLKPQVVVFENVVEMKNTIIQDLKGNPQNIIDYIFITLKDYVGKTKIVEFANYGVPERRQRLITVLFRKNKCHLEPDDYFPEETHSQSSTLFKKPWVTVNQALKDVPPLDAKSLELAKSNIPYHYVPVLDDKKYFWVSNTPLRSSAFHNQCINPNCRSQENPTHQNKRGVDGINRASKETPIHCVNCGEILPRPWVEKNGGFRLMSGFTSAYKRMSGDLPASALTRNLSYVCSDQKIHPIENRVLSIYEACILHTISDYDFIWKRADGKKTSDKLIREIIGESIPPRGLEIIFKHLERIMRKWKEMKTLVA